MKQETKNNFVVEYEWDKKPMKLTYDEVKKYISTDQAVSDKEVFMFMKLCQAQGLNPFVKEAYLIKYSSSPATMVVGKETFLKRAEANGEFDGYDITDEGEIPEYSVSCKVFRKNLTHPITVSVDYKEYVGTDSRGNVNRMWKGKPKTMLRKVALMQALREAFPIALGGLYEESELDQREQPKFTEAESEVVEEKEQSKKNPATEKQLELLKKLKVDPLLIEALTFDEASKLIKEILDKKKQGKLNLEEEKEEKPKMASANTMKRLKLIADEFPTEFNEALEETGLQDTNNIAEKAATIIWDKVQEKIITTSKWKDEVRAKFLAIGKEKK